MSCLGPVDGFDPFRSLLPDGPRRHLVSIKPHSIPASLGTSGFFAEMAGGFIWVESTGEPGSSSTFLCVCPVLRPISKNLPPLFSRRCFITEDTPGTRHAEPAMLRHKHGHTWKRSVTDGYIPAIGPCG